MRKSKQLCPGKVTETFLEVFLRLREGYVVQNLLEAIGLIPINPAFLISIPRRDCFAIASEKCAYRIVRLLSGLSFPVERTWLRKNTGAFGAPLGTLHKNPRLTLSNPCEL